MEESFELRKLALEAHVRKDDRPLLAGVREGIVEAHVSLLHQVRYHTGGRARDTSVTMNED